MERNVEIDKISDGKRYGANDHGKSGLRRLPRMLRLLPRDGRLDCARPDGCLPAGEKSSGKTMEEILTGWDTWRSASWTV